MSPEMTVHESRKQVVHCSWIFTSVTIATISTLRNVLTNTWMQSIFYLYAVLGQCHNSHYFPLSSNRLYEVYSDSIIDIYFTLYKNVEYPRDLESLLYLICTSRTTSVAQRYDVKLFILSCNYFSYQWQPLLNMIYNLLIVKYCSSNINLFVY